MPLKKRFHRQDVLSIFLSVLLNAAMDVMNTSIPGACPPAAAVEWTVRSLMESIRLPGQICPSPSPMTANIRGDSPFEDMVFSAIRDLESDHSPILIYPLDGFVALLESTKYNVRWFCSPDDINLAVWQRTLFHFTEQHFAARATKGDGAAADGLSRILLDDSQKRYVLSIQELVGSYLLSSQSNTRSLLQRIGSAFTLVESQGSHAIAVFLHLMHTKSSRYDSPVEFFDLVKSRRKNITYGAISAFQDVL